ncbi:MAG: cation transporter, partial [Nitrospiraceae bacterium]
MATDPVCGMTVDEQTAPAKTVHKGMTYYFCAPGCKRTFEADPDALLARGHQAMGTAQPPQLITLTPRRPKAETAPASDSGRQPADAKSAGQSLTIPIEGMSCASCVAKIEQGLHQTPGVVRASVNLATEQATVEYLPKVTGPSAIADTIHQLGYNPVMTGSAGQTHDALSLHDAHKQAHYRDLKLTSLVAAMLTIPVMV